MRWIVSLKPIRMLEVCDGAFPCVSSTLPHFWNTRTYAWRRSPTHKSCMRAHSRAHPRHGNTHVEFIYLFHSSSACFPPRISNINTGKLATRAHHNRRITRACVLYRGRGILQGSLCCPVARQPSQHWCSCGDSKAMRKGSFKGADPALSPLWCQWDKSKQRLMKLTTEAFVLH